MARGKKKEELSLEEKLEQALVPVEEQPYEVPENWCWVIFDNVVGIKRGASPRPIKAYITDKEGVNWIKIGDSDSGKYINIVKERITPEGANKSVYVKSGSLLLSNSMSFGRPYILNVDGCIHDGWLAITPLKVVDKDFLYYALLASDWYFEQVAVGTAVRNLNSKRVADLPIAVPPYKEQKRIVDHIERLFAKLDEAKAKIQEALDRTEERKAAILRKAFLGELTEKWRKKNNVLKEWKTTTLKKCCQIGSGGTPSRKCLEYYQGCIPWIKTGEINWNEIYNAEECISEIGVENSSAKIYDEGAILVAMYGMGVTRGRAAILKTRAATNQAVCVLIPCKDVLNYYLFYYFMCNYWDIRKQAVGGNQLNLSATIIGTFEIEVPSMEEQQEIVKLLDVLLEKESQNKENVEMVLDNIGMIKKAILTKAFRGKLGTNNPKEESSIELLKAVLMES